MLPALPKHSEEIKKTYNLIGCVLHRLDNSCEQNGSFVLLSAIRCHGMRNGHCTTQRPAKQKSAPRGSTGGTRKKIIRNIFQVKTHCTKEEVQRKQRNTCKCQCNISCRLKKKKKKKDRNKIILTPDSAFLSKSLLGGSGKVMKKQWYSKGVFMARCLAKRPVSSDLCDLRFPLYLMLHLKKKYFHVINQIKAVRVTGYLVSAGIAFSCCCLSFCPRLYCLYSKPTPGLNLNKKTF